MTETYQVIKAESDDVFRVFNTETETLIADLPGEFGRRVWECCQFYGGNKNEASKHFYNGAAALGQSEKIGRYDRLNSKILARHHDIEGFDFENETFHSDPRMRCCYQFVDFVFNQKDNVLRTHFTEDRAPEFSLFDAASSFKIFSVLTERSRYWEQPNLCFDQQIHAGLWFGKDISTGEEIVAQIHGNSGDFSIGPISKNTYLFSSGTGDWIKGRSYELIEPALQS